MDTIQTLLVYVSEMAVGVTALWLLVKHLWRIAKRIE